MVSRTEAIDIVKGLIDDGKLEHDKNVMIVLLIGVELVTSPLPREVRTALNTAVKTGVLGHLPKDKATKKPEAYFHPGSEFNARAMRNKYVEDRNQAVRESLLKTMVHHETRPA